MRGLVGDWGEGRREGEKGMDEGDSGDGCSDRYGSVQ